MNERVPERIRVAVAGEIHAQRALVRRYLEDDGFAVVAVASTSDELLVAVRREEPDAVVIDDRLLGAACEDLRAAAPEARIVAVGSGAAAASGAVEVGSGAAAASGAVEVDARLDRGLGLARLTATLRELFEISAPAVVASELAPVPPERPPTPTDDRRIATRLGAIAAALALVAAAALAVVGGPRVLPGIRAEGPPILGPVDVPASSPLEVATHDLAALLVALRQDDTVQASLLARSLMDVRGQARAEGLPVERLDAQIRSALRPLMATLDPVLVSMLRQVMDGLVPPLPEGSASGSGDEGPVLFTSAGGATSETGTGGGIGSGGSSEGSGGSGGGGAGGSRSEGGSKGPSGAPAPSDLPAVHGDQANRPPKGGWHGQNPKRHGPPSHDHGHEDHGKGHGNGHGSSDHSHRSWSTRS